MVNQQVGILSVRTGTFHTHTISFYMLTCAFVEGANSYRSVLILLTCACIVNSNVYGLGDFHCIRYLTAVDSIRTTSPPVQKYHHMTSGSVEVPLLTTTRNSTSIREVPVPYSRSISTSIRMSATSSLISHTDQRIFTFTNVLQGHKTVVLVYSTFEGEPDICTSGKMLL